jgi:hypothetical protein
LLASPVNSMTLKMEAKTYFKMKMNMTTKGMKMEAKTYLNIMKVIMTAKTLMMKAIVDTINSSKTYFTKKVTMINKTLTMKMTMINKTLTMRMKMINKKVIRKIYTVKMITKEVNPCNCIED